MRANDRQVGGHHYQQEGAIQHWDFVASNNLDYFQGQITKYIARWRKKNGIQDLEKAKHFLEKYIEVEKAKMHPAVGSISDLVRKANALPPKLGANDKSLDPYRRKPDTTGQERPFGYLAEEDEGGGK